MKTKTTPLKAPQGKPLVPIVLFVVSLTFGCRCNAQESQDWGFRPNKTVATRVNWGFAPIVGKEAPLIARASATTCQNGVCQPPTIENRWPEQKRSKSTIATGSSNRLCLPDEMVTQRFDSLVVQPVAAAPIRYLGCNVQFTCARQAVIANRCSPGPRKRYRRHIFLPWRR